MASMCGCKRRVWLVGVGGIYAVVSRMWMWVESMGMVVRRYIGFLKLLIPTPFVSVLFLQQHPYFLFIFLMFFLSLQYRIVIVHSLMCYL